MQIIKEDTTNITIARKSKILKNEKIELLNKTYNKYENRNLSNKIEQDTKIIIKKILTKRTLENK